MKCGANEHDAVDAAQCAFEELFKKWDTVRNPKAWLRTVAFHIFLRLPVRNERALEDHDQASVLPASTRIELREEEQAVISALHQLPMTQRRVFALHYDKFETREIAEMLQMTEAAVRQNLARARAKLRELLGFTG